MSDLLTLEPLIWQFVLVFLRTGALVSLMPAIGEQVVPVRVKLAVALCFTLIVAPMAPALDAPDGPLDLVGLAGIEVAAGLILGIGIRLLVLALQTAGTIAAQAVSLSHILGGAGVEPTPAIGYVLMISAFALAMMAGLHVHAAEFLVRSYSLIPFGNLPGAQVLSAWGVAQVARCFTLAFMLAVPFVLASAIYNLALGVINRAMPQLMVAFVGAPVITLGGLALLALCAPLMLSVWLDAISLYLSGQGGFGQ